MEVYCVQVEYEGIRPSEDYTTRVLWTTLEKAKKALKEERRNILRKPGWADSIAIDKDDHFYAVEEEYYRESYRVTIQKETVHE